MDSVKTKKGTILPLVNLKGKSYLMVAHRLQWLDEEYANYTIETEFPVLTDDQTVARATITLLDETGKVIRKAQATKRETKKDFGDHTEKAETAAIGRGLAMLGLGTQHAISDLDEGNRIVDSPLVNPKIVVDNSKLPDNASVSIVANGVPAEFDTNTTKSKRVSFRKPSNGQVKSGW